MTNRKKLERELERLYREADKRHVFEKLKLAHEKAKKELESKTPKGIGIQKTREERKLARLYKEMEKRHIFEKMKKVKIE